MKPPSCRARSLLRAVSGVYYNDHDPFACAWLRELIRAGELPEGEVDDRSILDVDPADLRPFRQCHFFAGIGGWPLALKLARWPSDAEVWTGSCPCQPLSVAGKRRGHADERHLWPAFYRLVEERRPAVVFGEQVAGADGREWLAGIRADLEDAGYACGAANLPACAVGAPHRRERIFWCGVADTGSGSVWRSGRREDHEPAPADQGAGDQRERFRPDAGAGRGGGRAGSGPWGNAEWRIGADGKARRVKPGIRLLGDGLPNRVGRLRGYGNAVVPQVAALFIEAFVML
jgi:DNA (cytosine-5)-methyltransferase 1